ncbi:hypothetical protein C0993_004745 [Termitomyces sp. T159_Od127]|nr:hypothetical protein C0993_004745 [Termitomyces sp. T159_Od127]
MLGFSGEGNSTTNGLGTMRLGDDGPLGGPPQRSQRKRKTPPESVEAPPALHHVLPPMIHPHALPPGYPYPDFAPAPLPPHPDAPQPSQPARALSNSKRAEQNRKAQRAFRERRDQHVKALESRSQLLDAALASADEANRRWEECRALVDQLRIENAALRAALQQAQSMPTPQPPHDPGAAAQQQLEEATRSLEAVVNDSLKSEAAADAADTKAAPQ